MLWKTEIIGRVPNNFHLSEIIAQKVSNNATKQSLGNNYFKFFNEHLKLGIIDKIEPEDYVSHIWIPHRPVIK